MDYFAHSGTRKDFGDWQHLRAHLLAVAEGAEERAADALPGRPDLAAAARLAGLLHDLGKYRAGFQTYIMSRKRGGGGSLSLHKEAGAAKSADAKHSPVAMAILGHHGGMPDITSGQSTVKAWLALPELSQVWSTAVADFPELAVQFPAPPKFTDPLECELFTRILFGCLVDADWSNTREHELHVKKEPADPEPPPLQPAARLSRVLAFIDEQAKKCPESYIRDTRAKILNACLSAADGDAGRLYSLTVPTGGGKTLAGLAFALKHAAKHGLRRVIYVAPYMTILEQNADVFRKALGVGEFAADVLTHYSLAEPPGGDDGTETDRAGAARRAENWDAPVVVTTNVQFFESLFSNKPGRCRKLPNIARSVIILDECQTLPPGLAAPTCGMLKQVASALGSTVVLCTATQPAFDHENLGADRLTATLIIPPEMNLFSALKRVELVWPVGKEVWTWNDVATEMVTKRAALCVVNTKKAARAVYDALRAKDAPGVFHLSTAMCPAHRREKLKQIRGLLDAKAPCYVVSTQLIEAGVDVDFPVVLREMGPFESVIQAAGRCNREGRLREGGRVRVFRSEDGGIPKGWYVAGRDKLEEILAANNGVGPKIDDPDAIRDYFSRLFFSRGKDALDACAINEKRKKFQFETIANGESENGEKRAGKNAYRLIDDPGQPVVVATWAAHRDEIASLLRAVEERPNRENFRRLAPFQVNLFPSQVSAAEHLFHEGPNELLVWDGVYDADAGIVNEMADAFIV